MHVQSVNINLIQFDLRIMCVNHWPRLQSADFNLIFSDQ